MSEIIVNIHRHVTGAQQLLLETKKFTPHYLKSYTEISSTSQNHTGSKFKILKQSSSIRKNTSKRKISSGIKVSNHSNSTSAIFPEVNKSHAKRANSKDTASLQQTKRDRSKGDQQHLKQSKTSIVKRKTTNTSCTD